MQRSFIALLKGDLHASLKYYPPGLLLVSTFLFAFLHVVFRIKQGHLIIQVLFISAAVLIIANYIYKIITKQLI